MKRKALLALTFLPHLLFANQEEEVFKSLPKAELHLHLGGSFPKEYLFSLATDNQKEVLEKSLDSIAKGVNYNDVFQVFKIIAQLVNTEEKLQEGTKELCRSLQEDNVPYVEIRTGLKDLGKGLEEYLKAVLSGIKESESEKFKAKVILSLQRNSSLAIAEKTVDLALKYKDLGVVGIDISGDSTIGQINAIMHQLLRAKNAGLSFVVHMGEVKEETDQMLLLEMLAPKRIGHAVHLCKEAKDWILENQIPVEVCLSSSKLVQMVQDYNEHPGIELCKKGHPVIFCTDDPLLFSTTVSNELFLAHRLCDLTLEEIKKAVANSFSYVLKE